MIKNAKFSGYCFDMNLNIWGDFQICNSLPLRTVFEYIPRAKFNFAIFDIYMKGKLDYSIFV